MTSSPDERPAGAAPRRHTSLGMRRFVYKPLGILCVGLGVIGLAVPMMPGAVFLILAAWFFARSSPDFEHWLLTHRIYGPIVRDWREHGAIPRHIKLIAVTSFVPSFALVWALGAPPVALVATGLCLAAVGAFILTRPNGPR